MVSVSLAWRPKGTATDHKKSDGGGRENQKTKIWARENVPPKHLCKVKPKEKNSCMNKVKSSNYGLRGSQDDAKHYTRLLNFLLNRAFLSVLRKNAAWTEVSHIFQNVFLEKYSTFKGDIWPFCSTCSTNRSVACYILCFKLLNSGEFKKKAEIWRQILRSRFFCVFKASDFPSC